MRRPNDLPGTRQRSVLRRALSLGTGPIMFAALFSLVSNLLFLAYPLYTTQVYSRVLTSQSGSTLIVLTLGIAFVFIVSSAIDHLRDQVLAGFGVVFDQQVAAQVFAALFDAVVRRQDTRAQALRDLDVLRQTVGGPAIGALFDLPWMPLFMLVLFVADPWIGLATLVGMVTLGIIAFLQERATSAALKTATTAAIQSYGYTDSALRNGEVVRALGMLPRLGQQWSQYRHKSLSAGLGAAETASRYQAVTKYVRMMIQVAVIAIGAYLVILRQIPSGLLFANMILAARAMAPIERLVGSWKTLFEASQAYRRLEGALAGYQPPCLLYTSPSPRDLSTSRMPSSA